MDQDLYDLLQRVRQTIGEAEEDGFVFNQQAVEVIQEFDEELGKY